MHAKTVYELLAQVTQDDQTFSLTHLSEGWIMEMEIRDGNLTPLPVFNLWFRRNRNFWLATYADPKVFDRDKLVAGVTDSNLEVLWRIDKIVNGALREGLKEWGIGSNDEILLELEALDKLPA